MKKKSVCKKCGKKFILGYNGVCNKCDKCAGVKRDKNGYAWNKKERKNGLTFLENGIIVHKKWEDEKD